jgi:hypothetical protein
MGNRIATVPQAYWFGRDPTQVAQRVLAINGPAGTILTQGSLTITPNADFIRLRRVYSDLGVPIKGTFYCTAAVNNANGSWTYTVVGLPDLTLSSPSGTARRDLLASQAMVGFTVKLYASRKVGRPFGLYRGRRSKVRA